MARYSQILAAYVGATPDLIRVGQQSRLSVKRAGGCISCTPASSLTTDELTRGGVR
jgi:hypothetical protein